MARTAEAELERLQAGVPVAGLIEASGGAALRYARNPSAAEAWDGRWLHA
jgi:hypothetical protein